MKKNFLLRIDEEIFDRVKSISETEDRSINYMIGKLIEKGLNGIDLDEGIEKDIEDLQLKAERVNLNLLKLFGKCIKKLINKLGG